ncbi:MAG TPA: FUSC family protein, partial [Propionibacteriaceae bacterium]
TGEPWERTKIYGAALLAGIGLVSLGTVLAVNTWAAVAGMLVVGFAIAYAGVGGPRVVGAANGLQLLYIMPSFPPYAPESLGSRLIGLILGVGLLAIADRVLLPPPVPKPFRHRLAEATRAVHDRLVTVLNSEGDRQPQAQPESAISLRLSGIPPLERPTGPGRRDRAAMHAVTILRGLEARVGALAGLTLTHQSRATAIHNEGRKLLVVSAHSLDESAEALESPPDRRAQTDSGSVEAALAGYLRRREAVAGSSQVDQDLPNRLRFAIVTEEFAAWAWDLAVATRIVQGDQVPEPPTRSIAEPFWYSNRSTPSLWLRRFRGHFTPRSVFFQNAVRLAVGLAAARLVAGLLDLSHGFWMLLATLTLMRTSVAATRSTVLPAFLGTTAGGLVAAFCPRLGRCRFGGV